MSTIAQITANQLNAQSSTGPTTPEGKSTSAQNATKHGLTAAYPVIRTEEERTQFETLTAKFEQEVRPSGQSELTIFKQLILAAWNIDRCHRLESELSADSEIDPLLDESLSKTIARIETYRMRAERNFYKALKELKANRPSGKFQERAPVTFEQNKPKYIEVPYIRPSSKVGRNEPCPCASGKKYKQCCLQNEPNLTQAA